MSEKYDNTNRIAIWENTEKRDGKQDKDYTGTLTVKMPSGETADFWVSLWSNENGSSKSPIFSGSVVLKDGAPARLPNRAGPPSRRQTPTPQRGKARGYLDDDSGEIPF